MEWLVTHVVAVLLGLADAVQSPALEPALLAFGAGAAATKVRAVGALASALGAAVLPILSGSSSNSPALAPSPASPSAASPPTPRKRRNSETVAANDNRPPAPEEPLPEVRG